MPAFELKTTLRPAGDQEQAIAEITEGMRKGTPAQVLLGVTGSGKTFTMANVVARLNRPALVIAHNKTLAAQLYGEFKELFPDNAVEYFVSYYDYYQPEAYVPSSDTYIEKDSSINDQIDRMRHAATHSLLTRHDVLIVASVSCIYGLGTAEAYLQMVVRANLGTEYPRDKLLRDLVDLQYERNDYDFHRATFRARGETVEIFPAYEEERAIRITYFGDTIEKMQEFDPLRGRTLGPIDKMVLFPASHYVTPEDRRRRAMETIREELRERLTELKGENKLVEAQRLEQRTLFDLEMMEQMGYCNGIENYSRHLSGRKPGEPPPCLLDYFPKDYLLFIDESHQTIPQIGSMYRGDRSRKEILVEYGFRLPSALDNRPLRFEEFLKLTGQTLFVSATPATYELDQTKGVVTEQIIRPTGLVDPEVEVRPAKTQVDDLLEEIRKRVVAKERVLVTTLTKRMAEDLTEYYADLGIKVRYLHADIDTLERSAIIRDLRKGDFDVLVGINLLREGLDIPEVALVAILDADKEGFLRSEVSLIQTIGRAARNVNGRVIMYAEARTDSIKKALAETDRRRALQRKYNEIHGITPQSVKKNIHDLAAVLSESDYVTVPIAAEDEEPLSKDEIKKLIDEYSGVMHGAAEAMEFERAAEFRDKVLSLKDMDLGLKPPIRSLIAVKKQAPPARAYPMGRRRGAMPRRR